MGLLLALAGQWRLIVAVALLTGFAGLWGGFRLTDWYWQAREGRRLAAEVRARDADLERAQAVAAAYENIRAELRRLSTINRVEVTREIQKIEYRCPVPGAALQLLDDAVSAANRAAGEPGRAVPAPVEQPAGRPRGAAAARD